MKAFPNNKYVVDAVISNVEGIEAAFFENVLAFNQDSSLLIHKRMQVVLADIESAKDNSNTIALRKQFPKGVRLFKSTCLPCHGADGNGVKMLACPLNQSEWMIGDKGHLIPIVLYGLTGPVKLNGVLYDMPEISGDMPGICYEPDVVDEDIAQLLSYIHKARSNDAGKISVDDVSAMRQKF